MKNNLFTKLRQHKRTYDFAEYRGGRKFVKHRSHKRSRQQIKTEAAKETTS